MNRRNFLKSVGVACGLAVAAPLKLFPKESRGLTQDDLVELMEATLKDLPHLTMEATLKDLPHLSAVFFNNSRP